MQDANQAENSKRFSLRSVLLLVLLVGFAAGVTALAVGTGLARTTSSSSTSTTQQSTCTSSSTGAATSAHNCTRTG